MILYHGSITNAVQKRGPRRRTLTGLKRAAEILPNENHYFELTIVGNDRQPVKVSNSTYWPAVRLKGALL